MISYGRQTIDQADVEAVVDVLGSEWLTQGPTVERFEAAVAEYVGARHAVAFSSATAALHGAAFATGLGSGDHVYTSPLTFMASANAARFVGARPGLVDISEETLNINLNELPSDADAVIPVHFAGLPLGLSEHELPKRTRVVIEDAAHALGAADSREKVGSCANSDVVCFSFHPVKPITTGEGGMAVTNNSEIAERLSLFRSHGIERSPELGGWFYQISVLGFNYRMTDMQAALGLSQLSRLDKFLKIRNDIAEYYRANLKKLPVQLPPEAREGSTHGYHLFPIQVKNRKRVYDNLIAMGIGVQVHYVPVHHHPISKDLIPNPSGYPIADKVYSQILSLPIHPSLTEKDLRFIVAGLEASMDG